MNELRYAAHHDSEPKTPLRNHTGKQLEDRNFWDFLPDSGEFPRAAVLLVNYRGRVLQ